MKTLILLRHGQSEWNLEDRFTGWTDVDLSGKGREEAQRAGRLIMEAGLKPRYFFTSYLKRAIHTLQIAADEMDRAWVPVFKDWHLNERHYGALQGNIKKETRKEYGVDQVELWRRSYDVMPPALSPDDPRSAANEEKYADLTPDEIPLTENLELTVQRVRPVWEERIVPALRLYDTVMVTAHGNSLRALIMMLLHKTPEEIVSEEIPTGTPRVLTLDDTTLSVISDRYLK